MRVTYLSGCFKPASEVSSSHAGRVFNEQNATVEILRFVMRDQIHRSACNSQEPRDEKRTIGSRFSSAVCTNEVALFSNPTKRGAMDSIDSLEVFSLREYSRWPPMLLSNSAVKPLFSSCLQFKFNPLQFTRVGDLFVKSYSRFKTPMCICSFRFRLDGRSDATRGKYDAVEISLKLSFVIILFIRYCSALILNDNFIGFSIDKICALKKNNLAITLFISRNQHENRERLSKSILLGNT